MRYHLLAPLAQRYAAHTDEGGEMHKAAYNWAGFACMLLAAGSVAGVFVGSGVAGRIGSGVIAAAALWGAWRFWGLSTGRRAPREIPSTPEGRPWER